MEDEFSGSIMHKVSGILPLGRGGLRVAPPPLILIPDQALPRHPSTKALNMPRLARGWRWV
jgi:hypothetical protein